MKNLETIAGELGREMGRKLDHYLVNPSPLLKRECDFNLEMIGTYYPSAFEQFEHIYKACIEN